MGMVVLGRGVLREAGQGLTCDRNEGCRVVILISYLMANKCCEDKERWRHAGTSAGIASQLQILAATWPSFCGLLWSQADCQSPRATRARDSRRASGASANYFTSRPSTQSIERHSP